MARFVALLILVGVMFVGCDQSTSSSTEGALVAADQTNTTSDPAADSNNPGQTDPITPPIEVDQGTDEGTTEDPPPDAPPATCEPVPGWDKVMIICHSGGAEMSSPLMLRFRPMTCKWDLGDPPDADPWFIKGIKNEEFLEAMDYYGCKSVVCGYGLGSCSP